MITYQFAYADKLKQTLHINEVTEKIRQLNNFYCNVCQQKMAAHLKNTRAKHFQHINYVEHSYETFLHKNAKKVFKESYEKCLETNTPFTLEYHEHRICNGWYKGTGIKCDLGKCINLYDLTKKFTKILEEKDINNFRPDLRFYGDQVDISIFVEIFVSHKSTDKKTNSENRIIEIKIENEEDILSLKRCRLSIRDPKIKYYNFDVKYVEGDFCCNDEKGCRKVFEYFALYDNGRYTLSEDRLSSITTIISTGYMGNVVYHEINTDREDTFGLYRKITRNKKILSILDRVKEKKLRILDCNLCRYHALNNRKSIDKEIFCKFRKIQIRSDEAFDCEYFRTFKNY